MLKGNLSTRPFYNERLVTVAIGVVAVLVLILTIFNATELVRLSSERRTIQARVDSDQAEAAKVRAHAASLQQTVDRTGLGRLAEATREANNVIDQRTFSWTAFFRQIEKTLPTDVRLTTVSPRVEKGAFKVTVDVVARSLVDINAFLEALRGTGAFYDVAPISQQPNDDNTFSATVEAGYLPAAAATLTDKAPPAAGQKP